MTCEVIAIPAVTHDDATIITSESCHATVFRAALVVALLVFGLFSSHLMWEVGYLGIWRAGLANLGAMRILADLVVVVTLLRVNSTSSFHRGSWAGCRFTPTKVTCSSMNRHSFAIEGLAHIDTSPKMGDTGLDEGHRQE